MSEEQIHKIYIGNLAPTVTEFMLLKVLRTCGKIKNLKFRWHDRGGRGGGRGFGGAAPARRRAGGGGGGYLFVEYATRDAAKKAIHLLHNQRIHGRPITCTFAAAKVGMSEDYSKNYASDLPAAARAVSGGAEADVDEVQQYQAISEMESIKEKLNMLSSSAGAVTSRSEAEAGLKYGPSSKRGRNIDIRPAWMTQRDDTQSNEDSKHEQEADDEDAEKKRTRREPEDGPQQHVENNSSGDTLETTGTTDTNLPEAAVEDTSASTSALPSASCTMHEPAVTESQLSDSSLPNVVLKGGAPAPPSRPPPPRYPPVFPVPTTATAGPKPPPPKPVDSRSPLETLVEEATKMLEQGKLSLATKRFKKLGLKKHVVLAVGPQTEVLRSGVLACCDAALDKFGDEPGKGGATAVAAKKTKGKFLLAQFIDHHRGALNQGTVLAAGQDPSTLLLQTLLEQDMHTLEDARSFTTADSLTALGVPRPTVDAFFAAPR